jgi:hypothetical protein
MEIRMEKFNTAIKRKVDGLLKPRGLCMVKKMIFVKPIGLYLRGLHIVQSPWDGMFSISIFVKPVFSTPEHLDSWIAQGPLVATTPVSGWNLDHDDFLENFTALLDGEMSIKIRNINTGSDYRCYLIDEVKQHRLDQDLCDIKFGWAYLHMGQLNEVRDAYLRNLSALKNSFMPGAYEIASAWPDYKNMKRVVDLISKNPDAIPEHCNSVARQAIFGAKLSKHWNNAEFKYVPDFLPG